MCILQHILAALLICSSIHAQLSAPVSDDSHISVDGNKFLHNHATLDPLDEEPGVRWWLFCMALSPPFFLIHTAFMQIQRRGRRPDQTLMPPERPDQVDDPGLLIGLRHPPHHRRELSMQSIEIHLKVHTCSFSHLSLASLSLSP